MASQIDFNKRGYQIPLNRASQKQKNTMASQIDFEKRGLQIPLIQMKEQRRLLQEMRKDDAKVFYQTGAPFLGGIKVPMDPLIIRGAPNPPRGPPKVFMALAAQEGVKTTTTSTQPKIKLDEIASEAQNALKLIQEALKNVAPDFWKRPIDLKSAIEGLPNTYGAQAQTIASSLKEMAATLGNLGPRAEATYQNILNSIKTNQQQQFDYENNLKPELISAYQTFKRQFLHKLSVLPANVKASSDDIQMLLAYLSLPDGKSSWGKNVKELAKLVWGSLSYWNPFSGSVATSTSSSVPTGTTTRRGPNLTQEQQELLQSITDADGLKAAIGELESDEATVQQYASLVAILNKNDAEFQNYMNYFVAQRGYDNKFQVLFAEIVSRLNDPTYRNIPYTDPNEPFLIDDRSSPSSASTPGPSQIPYAPKKFPGKTPAPAVGLNPVPLPPTSTATWPPPSDVSTSATSEGNGPSTSVTSASTATSSISKKTFDWLKQDGSTGKVYLNEDDIWKWDDTNEVVVPQPATATAADGTKKPVESVGSPAPSTPVSTPTISSGSKTADELGKELGLGYPHFLENAQNVKFPEEYVAFISKIVKDAKNLKVDFDVLEQKGGRPDGVSSQEDALKKMGASASEATAWSKTGKKEMVYKLYYLWKQTEGSPPAPPSVPPPAQQPAPPSLVPPPAQQQQQPIAPAAADQPKEPTLFTDADPTLSWEQLNEKWSTNIFVEQGAKPSKDSVKWVEKTILSPLWQKRNGAMMLPDDFLQRAKIIADTNEALIKRMGGKKKYASQFTRPNMQRLFLIYTNLLGKHLQTGSSARAFYISDSDTDDPIPFDQASALYPTDSDSGSGSESDHTFDPTPTNSTIAAPPPVSTRSMFYSSDDDEDGVFAESVKEDQEDDASLVRDTASTTVSSNLNWSDEDF